MLLAIWKFIYLIFCCYLRIGWKYRYRYQGIQPIPIPWISTDTDTDTDTWKSIWTDTGTKNFNRYLPIPIPILRSISSNIWFPYCMVVLHPCQRKVYFGVKSKRLFSLVNSFYHKLRKYQWSFSHFPSIERWYVLDVWTMFFSKENLVCTRSLNIFPGWKKVYILFQKCTAAAEKICIRYFIKHIFFPSRPIASWISYE